MLTLIGIRSKWELIEVKPMIMRRHYIFTDIYTDPEKVWAYTYARVTRSGVVKYKTVTRPR